MNKQIKINLNGVEVMATVTQEEYDKAYPKVRKYGRVERGEKYYYSAFGFVRMGHDDRCDFDDNLYAKGEYYPTEEEAIKDIERKKARMRIIRRIEELNDGWEPDFEDEETDSKYYVSFKPCREELGVSRTSRWLSLEPCFYMKSEEIAEQMIREHGDDYKFLWGIV